MNTNKRKIVNDPVYGFISINNDLIFDLIEHPWVQRLRRIRQLGLTNLVYPGAMHTRFQHVLGAYFLMNQAIEVIRSKGHEITDAEAEAVNIAILLHDIGHGPFSHALEFGIIEGFTHESISELLMAGLNKQFNNRLSLAIAIFQDKYHKHFLHQLVSGQLDMDRLDYLRRDSFFTGVSEGVVGSDRIIKMLNVVDDKLVVEAKGIYSIEKFLIARRLMYWQVYLHKTVLSAENLLINILKRAKELSLQGDKLFAPPALDYFLSRKFDRSFINAADEKDLSTMLQHFVRLDDTDIISATKVWMEHDDKILSTLCQKMISRQLYKIELQNQPFSDERIAEMKEKTEKHFSLSSKEASFMVFADSITSNIYETGEHNIGILYNNGKVVDIAEASDMLNMQVLTKVVTKHFLCYPKEIISKT